jgi:hypothetical protein
VPADPLLLVVHGRAGGEIPAALRAFAAELAGRRGAAVELDALTAGGSPPPLAGRVTLMPLLLLPGRHVRDDVPALRRALRRRGVRVRAFPFLGGWQPWQEHLHGWLDSLRSGGAEPLLVHHPLDDPPGRRYLAMLRDRLGVPLIDAAAAVALVARGGSARTLLPLALAPNRMTAALESALAERPGGASPLACRHLLDQPRSRSVMLDLLARLP